MCGSSQISKCTKPVLAIRREELMWKRRAPLSADHVRELCQKDIKVIVQSCNRRVFTNESYSNAGAEIREDISDASVILGVKEVSIEHLLPDKTYCFFCHATKGEPQNTAI
ncbi:hypothetical protein JTE90_024646 [Oedothorax gibbosus]|uniref:Alanine dehydrogenase/pyridine nucleotide transhydrogenase N-terminal domain-containing protein n=1 Tax=Oedothorax gibbosus TaxID=931172 RepID=A0AAV6U418_9ARAC|nr:hypothetical protein JTE90_024646 [Oedothorax gibbosus]